MIVCDSGAVRFLRWEIPSTSLVTVGFDQTGKPPASAEEEARLAMHGVKRVLKNPGVAMDNLVSVQVFCTDFSLYDKFNGVCRTYFHRQFALF